MDGAESLKRNGLSLKAVLIFPKSCFLILLSECIRRAIMQKLDVEGNIKT